MRSSLLNCPCSGFGAVLTPKDLTHERLEFFVVYLSRSGSLHLREHLRKLFVTQVLALTAEALFQVRLSDKPSVVDVKVMERKSHICLRDSSSAVDSDSKELAIVDLAIMVEINALEDLINFLL